MSIESVSWALHVATEGLKSTEKLVLIGIANHDGDGGAWPSIATLAKYALVSERRVQQILVTLEELQLVKRHPNQGGTARTPPNMRPNLFELNIRGEAHFTGGGEAHFTPGVQPTSPEPSMNHPDEPSSSLRSDENSDGEESGTPRADRVNEICTRYWDTYSELRGIAPTASWMTLRAVVRKVLKSVDDDDEIVTAMVNTKMMTGEGVMEEIARSRARAGEQVTTSPINPKAMRLYRAWTTWGGDGDPSDKIGLLQSLTTYMSWDVTPGEVAARLGGFARANGPQTPTLDALRQVPLPPWQGDANWTVEDIFVRFATAERRLAR